MKKIFDWLRTNIGELQVDASSEGAIHESHKGHPRGDGLFLTKQQLNRTIVLLLLTSLFIFVGGYFWGQHTAAEQLLTMVERDSFADQVYYSMSATERGDDEGTDEDTASAAPEEAAPSDAVTAIAQADAPTPTENVAVVVNEIKQPQYKGILAGFSAEKMANQMAQRLKRRGFDVSIITRHSRTRQGRSVDWYQAVTAPMGDKTQLEQVVAQIKKFEKLHDVSIVSLS